MGMIKTRSYSDKAQKFLLPIANYKKVTLKAL